MGDRAVSSHAYFRSNLHNVKNHSEEVVPPHDVSDVNEWSYVLLTTGEKK